MDHALGEDEPTSFRRWPDVRRNPNSQIESRQSKNALRVPAFARCLAPCLKGSLNPAWLIHGSPSLRLLWSTIRKYECFYWSLLRFLRAYRRLSEF